MLKICGKFKMRIPKAVYLTSLSRSTNISLNQFGITLTIIAVGVLAVGTNATLSASKVDSTTNSMKIIDVKTITREIEELTKQMQNSDEISVAFASMAIDWGNNRDSHLFLG